ncbi:Efflux pump membrane transporter BepE [Pseudobythopirellula maris]|uniref:Efflux pump membrane transporter BepE n=1 Tax=Pseudobythopirellula maris TaxID=2527991 RepID=A0A5C5ZUM4_9BACT|nr:efflux RND transporter permease subunit [Pseudobythopirellula maris]TWT89893.1 Efflux pump membrane transporter BepE [Pseudobythopirellula maris]
MNLLEGFVKNPVKVSVGVLLLALFGCVSLLRMPMQLTPEVETPTITITTDWPGASPQEVEREIVVEQEEQLKGVEGARKLSAECNDSRGVITIEFNVGTDMDQALLKVNSRLQQVREYPVEANQPVITTANSSNQPIAWFILSATPASDAEIDAFAAKHPELADRVRRATSSRNVGLSMLRLRKLAEEEPAVAELLPPADLEVQKLRRFAEDEIEARFERVSGVSQANVIGGLEEELQVVVDPEELAARQLTLGRVRDVLQGQNRDTSAGDFWEGKRRWVVRSLGEFRSPEQVGDQLLAVRDGAPVYVRDVAEVTLGYKKPTGLVQRFGESNIAVNCIRDTGANVLDVMAELRQVNHDLNQDILGPMGLELMQVYDETEYIDSSVNLVQQNIFIGGALTMVVLMSFLHFGVRTLLFAPLIVATAIAATTLSPWWFAVTLALVLFAGFWFARGALVVGLAIPVSIIGTFLVLGLLGRSLNVISLAGLAFAVGMLVDNAVVVLENIYRRHDTLGEPAWIAAVRGAGEVWGAVVSSTLTTIAVFLPVVFIEEEAGQLFRDIALAISAAVGLSLIVSITMIPTASARLFRRKPGHEDEPLPQGDAADRAAEAFGGRYAGAIVGLNGWILRGVFRQLATVVILVGLAVGVTLAFWPQVEYLPTGNRNLILALILPPPGYNVDQLLSMGEQVEGMLQPYWDVYPDTDMEELDGPAIYDFFFVVRDGGSVFLGVRAADPLRASELIPVLQGLGARLPGTFLVAFQKSLFEQGLQGGRTIDIEITGPEIERLAELGNKILTPKEAGGMGVSGLYPGTQARPVPSTDLSSPELHITPKLLTSAELEMSSAELGFTVDALVDGAFVGDYFHEGKKIDLRVIGEAKFADETHRVAAVPVATARGQLVPLDTLADVTLSSGPEQINHRERVRAITVQVSPPPEAPLEEAMRRINDEIVMPMREGGDLNGGYRIALAGTADKLSETWKALRFNVMLAVLITYLLMAALFESWVYPLVIILTVPLGAAGGVLGLAALNQFVLQPLDVLTMLGFVVLIGTVVNNPILIVHQSLIHMDEEAMAPREAILESVRTRIRPIFMTTTTTVLGLAPLVLFPGAGSELYRGLGSVVLGGLLLSTVFTLVLVPTLFSLALAIWRRPETASLGHTPRDLDGHHGSLEGGVSEQSDSASNLPAQLR